MARGKKKKSGQQLPSLEPGGAPAGVEESTDAAAQVNEATKNGEGAEAPEGTNAPKRKRNRRGKKSRAKKPGGGGAEGGDAIDENDEPQDSPDDENEFQTADTAFDEQPREDGPDDEIELPPSRVAEPFKEDSPVGSASLVETHIELEESDKDERVYLLSGRKIHGAPLF